MERTYVLKIGNGQFSRLHCGRDIRSGVIIRQFLAAEQFSRWPSPLQDHSHVFFSFELTASQNPMRVVYIVMHALPLSGWKQFSLRCFVEGENIIAPSLKAASHQDASLLDEK